MWRTHFACRVETRLDTSAGLSTLPSPGVAKSGDAARTSACATTESGSYRRITVRGGERGGPVCLLLKYWDHAHKKQIPLPLCGIEMTRVF